MRLYGSAVFFFGAVAVVVGGFNEGLLRIRRSWRSWRAIDRADSEDILWVNRGFQLAIRRIV